MLNPSSLRGRLSFRVIPGYPVLRVVRCASFQCSVFSIRYSLLGTFYSVLGTPYSTLNSQGRPRRSAPPDLCTASRFLRHWCRSCCLPELVDSHQLAHTSPLCSSLLTWVRLAHKSCGAWGVSRAISYNSWFLSFWMFSRCFPWYLLWFRRNMGQIGIWRPAVFREKTRLCVALCRFVTVFVFVFSSLPKAAPRAPSAVQSSRHAPRAVRQSSRHAPRAVRQSSRHAPRAVRRRMACSVTGRKVPTSTLSTLSSQLFPPPSSPPAIIACLQTLSTVVAWNGPFCAASACGGRSCASAVCCHSVRRAERSMAAKAPQLLMP